MRYSHPNLSNHSAKRDAPLILFPTKRTLDSLMSMKSPTRRML